MSKFFYSALVVFGISTLGSAQQIATRTDLNNLLSGGYEYTDAFEGFNVSDGGALTLGITSLNNTTSIFGQGPGLVDPGVTYSSGDGSSSLQWDGADYYGSTSENILSQGSSIVLTYSMNVNAMGIDLLAFSGFPANYTAQVYDGSTLVGSASGTLPGGASPVFFGWENGAGITSVVLSSSSYSWSPLIDNHSYGYSSAVPEPATLAGLALSGLALLRRRRK